MSIPQMEALDFRYLLLEYYKKLKISESELAVILMIDHLLEQKNTLITADLLSIKMSLSVDEIDKIMVKLIEKGYLDFNPSKKTKTTLKPLRKKIYELFQKSMANVANQESSETKVAMLKNIYEVFEKELNRTLSPLEFSLIQEWVDNGYKSETIIDALKEALSKKKRSLRSVDKILLQWQTRDDIEKTGYSAISDDWNLDMEKTMEIAKTKWVDD